MRILVSPDPILQQVCEPVELGDKTIRRLSKQMLREMYHADGVGLACPQVGILKRMVVIDTQWVEEDEEGRPKKKNPVVLVNPEIVDHSEERVTNSEGCLSVPGINCEIERWEWVKVACLDEHFEEKVYEGEGLFGRCMQHEIDHLDGVTLFERLKPLDRVRAIEAYQHLHAHGGA